MPVDSAHEAGPITPFCSAADGARGTINRGCVTGAGRPVRVNSKRKTSPDGSGPTGAPDVRNKEAAMAQDPREHIETLRAEAIADIVLPRLVTYAHKLVRAYPACRLDAEAVYEAGGKLAMMELYGLSPQVVEVLSNTILAGIIFRVGVAALFDAVDADLIRQHLPRTRRLGWDR